MSDHPAVPGQPAGADAGWQPVHRHAPSLDGGRTACGLGGVGLIVCLLALRWYGAVAPSQGLERTGRALSLGAWPTLGVARWPLVVLCAAGLLGGLVGRRGTATGGALLLLAAGVTALLIVRVLIDPPQPDRIVDVKLGGYVAVLCAAVVTLGAAERWHRAREPLRGAH